MEKETTRQEVQELVKKIVDTKDVKSLVFMGCGASYSELFGAYYYALQNSKELGSYLLEANEFNYDVPNYFGENTVAVIASLSGTTKETLKAVHNAKEKGATVLALTFAPDSPLTKESDYVLQHKFFESYATKSSKQKVALTFAVELLHALGESNNYNEMVQGLSVVDEVANDAAASVDNDAQKFAERHKDEDKVFTLSSGSNRGVGYSTANFIFMEMQWITGVNLDSAELFHGPFELAVEEAPFLLFMSDGRTRHLDSRALEFLQRFGTKYTVIDAKDYWLDSKMDASVVDYFDPLVLTSVMRKFAEYLGKARKHPLSKRRYMWKLENY